MKKMPIAALTLLTLSAAPAFAGSWAVGYGILSNDSPEAQNAAIDTATRNSLAAAKAAVASRGRGCIGRNEAGDDTRMEVEGNVVKVYTFYSHHNGSCGR